MRTVHADRMGVLNRKARVALPEREVVVIDGFTAESHSIGRPERPHVSNELMFKAEHGMPDGSAAHPNEHHFVPLMIAGLALFGLVVVGVSMYIVGGVQAMGMGLAWVIAGYAVGWSVVWAAGMIRTKEEGEIERDIWNQRAPRDVDPHG